jgi:hypothetical protein
MWYLTVNNTSVILWPLVILWPSVLLMKETKEFEGKKTVTCCTYVKMFQINLAVTKLQTHNFCGERHLIALFGTNFSWINRKWGVFWHLNSWFWCLLTISIVTLCIKFYGLTKPMKTTKIGINKEKIFRSTRKSQPWQFNTVSDYRMTNLLSIGDILLSLCRQIISS